MNRRRFATALAFTAAAPSLLLAFRNVLGQAEKIPRGAQEATFIEAVDGEMMKVEIEDKVEVVRFIGIDAPVEKNEDDYPECGFQESRQALNDAVAGRRIFLEPDAEDRDPEKRLWRHIWTATAEGENGSLLNEQLLQLGWVTLQGEEKNTRYADRYKAAAVHAIDRTTGLYATCGGHHIPVTPVSRMTARTTWHGRPMARST